MINLNAPTGTGVSRQMDGQVLGEGGGESGVVGQQGEKDGSGIRPQVKSLYSTRT